MTLLLCLSLLFVYIELEWKLVYDIAHTVRRFRINKDDRFH